jgi:hypothetical protein
MTRKIDEYLKGRYRQLYKWNRRRRKVDDTAKDDWLLYKGRLDTKRDFGMCDLIMEDLRQGGENCGIGVNLIGQEVL